MPCDAYLPWQHPEIMAFRWSITSFRVRFALRPLRSRRKKVSSKKQSKITSIIFSRVLMQFFFCVCARTTQLFPFFQLHVCVCGWSYINFQMKATRAHSRVKQNKSLYGVGLELEIYDMDGLSRSDFNEKQREFSMWGCLCTIYKHNTSDISKKKHWLRSAHKYILVCVKLCTLTNTGCCFFLWTIIMC